jgi:hypothetical protein
MYLVIELQTSNGQISTLNYQYDDIRLAEQKYYLILSAAAVSTIDVHAAMIVDSKGTVLKNEYYEHNAS